MPQSLFEDGAAGGALAAALAPLRDRLPRAFSEREILRVVATVPSINGVDGFTSAREEVLRWARNRSSANLPSEAWAGKSFEVLAAGRTTMAASVETGTNQLWGLRGDDPDKAVSGRIWSTEVSLGRFAAGEPVRLSVRLLVNSPESELAIEPAVPGLVLQIADRCGLRDGPLVAWNQPHYAETDEHVDAVIDWLLSPDRRMPIIVATGDERTSTPNKAFADVEILGKALCGLAHIVSIPAALTYKLSDVLGRRFAVFHGGIRIYHPRMGLLDDPRDHGLYLGATVLGSPNAIVSELRRKVARGSLRRTRLGHDVLTFAAVRSASLHVLQSRQADAGASDVEQLTAANKRVDALEKQIASLEGQVDQSWQLSEEESERAEGAEKQLHSAWARIEQLELALKHENSQVDADDAEPNAWDEFADWCDKSFSGRLALASSARRSLRKARFDDVVLAARCVRWLATEARDRFIDGGGSLSNIPVFAGILNAPCGADEYSFDFQGRRLKATWHIKNGGNTRQPERCLRIYYVFDEISRQVVVSDMPAHIETDAS
jgi:hypothetical protein